MSSIILFFHVFLLQMFPQLDRELDNVLINQEEQILQSSDYYCGVGVSLDSREAKDLALKELTEQIAVTITSSFEHKVKESSQNLVEDVKSIMSTHSRASLKNVQTLTKQLETGEISVFCYIRKSEVEKIFTARKKLIATISAKADKNESQANLAFALKLNYYALLLVNSLPDETIEYDGVNYTTKLPQKINHIIQNLNYRFKSQEIVSDKERLITFDILYKDKPVSLIDFSFWDGANQVLVRGRDGKASFHLFGGSVYFESLKLNTKIAYYENRKEYNVVNDLWDIVQKPVFNTIKDVKLELDSEHAEQQKEHIQATGDTRDSRWNIQLTTKDSVPCLDNISKSTQSLLDMLTQKDPRSLKEIYGSDPFLLQKLVNYMKHNNAEFPEPTVDAQINKTVTGFELRKLQMIHNYPTLNKQTTEYVVLDFNEHGQLIDINLSITENLYNTFVEQSKFAGDWSRRQQIIKFVEKYRTAYQTRDINMVSHLFTEEALIIIGREIKRKKLSEDAISYQKFYNQPDIEYLRLTKDQYIKRQEQVFKKQSDIFLDFSEFDIVKKNNAQDVYGVEMRQSYSSTTYSDEGYLFLLIDFSGHDPLIYVRAWQPNEWDKENLVKTSNFRIYK